MILRAASLIILLGIIAKLYRSFYLQVAQYWRSEYPDHREDAFDTFTYHIFAFLFTVAAAIMVFLMGSILYWVVTGG